MPLGKEDDGDEDDMEKWIRSKETTFPESIVEWFVGCDPVKEETEGRSGGPIGLN